MKGVSMQKLEDFIIEMHSDVERFKKMWEEGVLNEPQNYPIEMNNGDWYEQFIAFMS